MKLFYISKYANTPVNGNPSRQYMLSKYMNNNEGLDTTLIYSRSNGDTNKSFYRLYKTCKFDNFNTVQINGVLLNQMGFSFKRIFSWIQFEVNLFIFFLLLKKKNRPDAVIASSLSLLTFLTVSILKKMHGFKMIIEVRDIWPLTLVETGKFKERNLFIRILKKIELYGYKNADKVFSTLPKFSVYLESENIFNKDFICIPQGFDPNKVSEIDNKKTIKEKKFTVGYAGSIGNLDFVEELCEAAELLKEEDINFIIYGSGPMKEILKGKYSHLSKLNFAGRVPRDEIISKLQNTDVLVNMWGDKQLYDYGVSPNKWVDYMLAEKPIIVSYNGYKSIINDANCGWFIDANSPKKLADKLIEVSKMEKEELKRIGKNGREYVMKECNYQNLASKLLNFILSTDNAYN